jgi:hypothetical protein
VRVELGGKLKIRSYHKRPPRREDVGLNIFASLVRVEGLVACVVIVEGFQKLKLKHSISFPTMVRASGASPPHLELFDTKTNKAKENRESLFSIAILNGLRILSSQSQSDPSSNRS